MSVTPRDLFIDNPMNLEAVRVARRFLRTGGDTGRALNYTVLGIIGALYIWLHFVIVRFQEDMSVMLINFELGLLTIAVPMSIYAAVSGEREKLTWDSLVMTRLTPAQIVIGKLLWRFALIAGIMALYVPPLLLSHFGVSHQRGVASYLPEYTTSGLLKTQAIIASWSALLAVFTLFLSARSRRSVTTLSITSVVMLAFLVLTPVLVLMFDANHTIDLRYSDSALKAFGSALVHANPFYAAYCYSQTYLTGQNYRSHAEDSLDWIVSYLPWIFAGLAAFFAKATHRTLRGLEAPRKNPGQGGN